MFTIFVHMCKNCAKMQWTIRTLKMFQNSVTHTPCTYCSKFYSGINVWCAFGVSILSLNSLSDVTRGTDTSGQCQCLQLGVCSSLLAN